MLQLAKTYRSTVLEETEKANAMLVKCDELFKTYINSIVEQSKKLTIETSLQTYLKLLQKFKSNITLVEAAINKESDFKFGYSYVPNRYVDDKNVSRIQYTIGEYFLGNLYAELDEKINKCTQIIQGKVA